MPRPNLSAERRTELLPVIARTFAELGYRRTTTAELAARCDVQENALYRLWPDKKTMFIATIDHVYDVSAQRWKALLDATNGTATAAERLIDFESTHHGELGLYRIVFTGLSETDDEEILAALRRMYAQFHRFIRRQVGEHRDGTTGEVSPSADLSAWAIIGLGTVANIGRELNLLTGPGRKRLFADVGRVLLDGDHT